ncbi:MAG: OB-fold nucleic acid binding domain-containing protein [Candidatus Aenigmarchaeota archaeon]|nr:OB-fold nucleic acid binding domain-containing protein [Candidatus Aenigmarchaeota archaeon]
MKIAELRDGMRNVSLEAKVIDVSETRVVQTKYGRREVANATIEDDSGQVSLVLWREQIRAVNVGDKISVSGGFVTEFRDELQVNVPRSGKIEVIK